MIFAGIKRPLVNGWRGPALRFSLAVGAAALLMSSAVGASALPRFEEGGQYQRPSTDFPACTDSVQVAGFSDELNKTSFSGTQIGGLSALSYAGGNSYLTLVDHQDGTEARVYELSIPITEEGLGPVEPLAVTTLTDENGQPFSGANFDGEGLALAGSALFATSETEPAIRQFDLSGQIQASLPVPERFLVAPEGEGLVNGTFESLANRPTGSQIFTANELPLTSDGSTTDGRNRIRILEYDGFDRVSFEPGHEFYYLTEPGQRVVDLVALSDTELLVLERGAVDGGGNTIRIFKVSVDGAQDVSSLDSLASDDAEPLEKTLLVDVGADCPSLDAPNPGTQPNPLLDNFDGMTLGPQMGGGYQSLVLVSDDNFTANQVTRVLVLAVDSLALR